MSDDTDKLTPEDWDAIVSGWRALQHRGLWYEQPKIKNRPSRGSFTLPDDVVRQLGGGDPRAAGSVLHGMFGLAPFTGEGDPRVIDPDVVADIGNGSARAGRRVLERFVAMLRRQGSAAAHRTARRKPWASHGGASTMTPPSTSGPLGNRATWLKLVRGTFSQPMYDFSKVADEAGVDVHDVIAKLETFYLSRATLTLQ